jgi:2,3-bisphosphoglycerate-dependent phosphoglycerate mutase
MQLVLLRHGESTWNKTNLFTGWTDVPLSELGVSEARAAGRALASAGFAPDVCHTSYLKRAIKTLWLALEEMDQMWVPIHGTWRLNERHYGALQGLDKGEMAKKVGAAQVKLWRRSYDAAPPPVAPNDKRHPKNDPRYAALRPDELPVGESLKDTIARTLPYWEEVIAPELKSGKRVLIAAHGNSLRGLVKHLDGLSNDEVAGLEIPTGAPLAYELDRKLKPVSRRYLDLPKPPRAKRA